LDGLIILLIIIGFITRANKKKKKQQEAARRKAQAMAAAFSASDLEPKPEPKSEIKPGSELRREKPKAAASQVKIPFTRAEWDAFMAQTAGAAKLKPPAEGTSVAPKPSGEGRPSRRQPLPEGVSPALRSTQGERPSEHARHLERIAAEEKRQAEAAALQSELRSINRRKLRQAVIMSEILSKPVALRPRGQR